VIATLAIVAPLAYLWMASRMPDAYSVMDMGYPDYGGGPGTHGGGGHDHSHSGSDGPPAKSITELAEKSKRPVNKHVELKTEAANLNIGGKIVPGFTVNGKSPGPKIIVTEGELLEVKVTNVSVPAGVAIHWHGINVPNAMDGVAGVTQDAIGVGETFTYRFVVHEVGTYWYHSHQVSNVQVMGGLFGALIVLPKAPRNATAEGVTAVAHTYAGVRTLNGIASDLRHEARPGDRVRVRVINTDNAPMETWASTPYRVLAVDGTNVHGPTQVSEAVTLTAGARADLEISMPANGSAVRVQLSRATAVVLGPSGADVPIPAQPKDELDLLEYGTTADPGIDPARAVRHFDYSIGRLPGFVKGRPGMFWSINGRLYPNVPMYVVRAGDVVTMRIDNRSGDVHPMHLHGHRALVLSRNGKASTGSPWWVDSLNVKDNESFEIAFKADNPGIWMDHCHNLQHAVDGMVAHLMYEGYDTPYKIGGEAENEPE
jgi:FtsP/CotA-like multicopper oxidase with cupredoxin domain